MDAVEAKETKEAREEREKREFIEALRKLNEETRDTEPVAADQDHAETFGRIFSGEGDVMEEHEVVEKEKSALEILEVSPFSLLHVMIYCSIVEVDRSSLLIMNHLQEAARRKELKPVDHSTIQYIPFRKNLYIMPRALAKLPPEEVESRRNRLEIRVRGKGCPPPVDTWEQCGLAERILAVIHRLGFGEPFPIQKQVRRFANVLCEDFGSSMTLSNMYRPYLQLCAAAM